jgi:hypothetical protein
MAYKVSGTTVINNSRGLENITSVDSTTATAIGNAGVGGGTVQMTADGSISAGDVVGITSNGSVSTTSPIFGPTSTSYTMNSGTTDFTYYPKMAYDAAQNKVVWAGRDTNDNWLRVRVGTIASNGTITWGTTYKYTTGTAPRQIGLAMHNNIIVVTYLTSNYGNYKMMVSFGVSGTTITSNSGISYMEGSYYSAGGGDYANYLLPDVNNSGKFMVVYTGENSQYPHAGVITATGNSISISRQRLTTSLINVTRYGLAYSHDYNKFMAIYTGYGNFSYIVDLDIVNGALSVGTALSVDLPEDSDSGMQLAYDSVSGDYIAMSRSGGNAYAWTIFTNSSGVPQSAGGTNTIATGAGGDYYGRYTVDSSGNTTFGMIGIEGNNRKFFMLAHDGTGIITVTQTLIITDYMDSISTSNFDGLKGRGTYMALNKAVTSSTTRQATQVNTASSYFKALGISEGSYSNGQTATISITGGITTQKTGLTAGTYYGPSLDSTGGVSATSDRSFAYAIDSNKLIMK